MKLKSAFMYSSLTAPLKKGCAASTIIIFILYPDKNLLANKTSLNKTTYLRGNANWTQAATPPQFSGIPPPSKIINQRAAFPFPVPPEENGANTRFPTFD